MNIEGDRSTGYEEVNTYYYHSDHLGSAQLITDYRGGEYEHIEYTPYGELWIEEKPDGFEKIPFRFTGKELDRENNLYYYGARYYNARTSRWLSGDPAGVWLINPMRNRFFLLESNNWYNYCLNNPLKYKDPSGKFLDFFIDIGCVLFDVISFGYHAVKGDKAGMALDAVALAADLACTITPFGTGGGVAVRVAAETGERIIVEGGKVVAKAGTKTIIKGAQIAYNKGTEYKESNNNPSPGKKNVPNPNGKLGGPLHQGKIKELVKELKDKGYKVYTEFRVNTKGGYKNSRWGDILVRGNGEEYIIQVGKQTKAGNPVSREIKAIQDLNNAGYTVEFIPYN